MHNGAVRTRLLGPLLAALVPALLLSACSGGDEPEAAPSESATESASQTPEPLPTPDIEVPEGVELTAQGSALELGDTASVGYEVDQSTVGVLDITVTDMRRTTFKESFQGWKLDKQLAKANPYFVEATFKNRGETDLGGERPPLYIVDGNDTLVESSTFVTEFTPCPSTDFPKTFEPGDRVKRCLVFLAPDDGELVAVSFRPAQEFNPITWSGDVLKLGAKRPGDGDGQGGGDQENDGGKRKDRGGNGGGRS